MLRHDLKFDMILRGIVMTRGESGATIAEMRDDYYDIFLESWPLKVMNTNDKVSYLLQVDGLMMEEHESGLLIWYIDDIGSNISERYLDSNNNIVVSDSSLNLASLSINSAETSVNPNASIPQIMVTTSNGEQYHVTNTTSNQNGLNKSRNKRNLSLNDSTIENSPKRCLTSAQANLSLIEKNLDIHNRNSGANGLAKHTTSTEKEVSILVHGDANGSIEVNYSNTSNNHICHIHEPVTKQTRLSCTKRSQNSISTVSEQDDSPNSTVSLGEELFPRWIGIIGDDFMRSFMSFELFGGDFTANDDNKLGFCISGQTVRDAYHLVYDKQNFFGSKFQYIIVNVGAIDILRSGADLTDIQVSYARLVNAIDMIGCKPILTTIPDIQLNKNNPDRRTIRQTLLLFNRFVSLSYCEKYPIIDLHAALFSNGTDRTTFYYSEPKRTNVNGEELELYHWSDIGREEVFKAIKLAIGINATD